MGDREQAGVYAFEDGKSGIKRIDPPEWWLPKVDRKLMKSLTKRNNYRAFISHGIWLALLGGLGYVAAISFSWGGAWWVLCFFLYGTIFSCCNARWHESLHGTPFRTPFLNDIMFFLGSMMEFRDIVFTRWSHVTHHSYTIYTDVDLKMSAPRPVRLWKIIPEYLYIVSGVILIRQLVLHSIGIPTAQARRVVPERDLRKMFWAARVAVLVHLIPIGFSIAFMSWIPVLLFTFPRFYGGILVQLFILTQHAGLAENVPDHRLSTRTVLLNPVLSFLYMHMEYHIEHHLFPNVPFYSLRRLHKAIASQTPRPYKGLWEAYRVMIPVLLKQRRDASYYLKRELPEERPDPWEVPE